MYMQLIIVVNKGVEEIASTEVEELIKTKSKVEDTVLNITIKEKDIAKLCYFGQSFLKVLMLLKKGSIKSPDDIVLDMDLSKYVKKIKTFGVECTRLGEHTFNSVDVESKLIHIIGEAHNIEFTHENPDIIFAVYIYKDNYYFGIDLIGFDSSKRTYKIYNTPNSFKGTIGYAIARESNFSNKKSLLITNSKDGVIPIEAACFASKLSVNYYNKDKFIFPKYSFLKTSPLEKLDKKPSTPNIHALDPSNHNLSLMKKNAKIAGVDKHLKFSRMDLQWLDTKFDKASMDCIIGHLPAISKHKTENEIKKVYNEFFHQCSYIKKPKGTIITVTQRIDLLKESAIAHKLKVKKEKIFEQGQTSFHILTFS